MSSFKLEFVKDDQEQEFEFEKDSVSIGRDKGADFVLDHPTVSRQHSQIVADDRGHRLVVLSSSGLTAVNGEKVTGDVALEDGDEIHFGKLACTYRHTSVEEPAGDVALEDAPTELVEVSAPEDEPTQLVEVSAPEDEPTQLVETQSSPDASAVSEPSSDESAVSVSVPEDGPGPDGAPAVSTPGPDDSAISAPAPDGSVKSGVGVPSDSPTANVPAVQPDSPDTRGSVSSGSLGELSSAASDDDSADSEGTADDGLRTWEEIAASADDEDEDVDEKKDLPFRTDYEKMKEAQERAEKQSKGTSPVLIVGVVLAVVLLAAVYLIPRGGGGGGKTTKEKKEPTGQITMTVDCVGKADCKAKAISAYKVGKAAYDKMGADVTNLYEAHYQFARARKLLEKSKVASRPSELSDLEEMKASTSEQLKKLFQRHRVNFVDSRKRKDYRKMAEELDKLRGYIPDDRCDYHKWADNRESEMKDGGIYPYRPTSF